MGCFILTFDIDWAPDWAIWLLLDELSRKKVKAIFFGTHKTALNDVIVSEGHELGIHPNFTLGTSESAKTPITCELDRLRTEVAASPRFIRSHCLRTDTQQLAHSFDFLPTLVADLSMFTPGYPELFASHWNQYDRTITRINYQWEDSLALQRSIPLDPLQSNSLQILNFHPIHVSLNSSDINAYSQIKKINKHLYNLSYADCKPFINEKDDGIRDRLLSLIDRAIDYEYLLENFDLFKA